MLWGNEGLFNNKKAKSIKSKTVESDRENKLEVQFPCAINTFHAEFYKYEC